MQMMLWNEKETIFPELLDIPNDITSWAFQIHSWLRSFLMYIYTYAHAVKDNNFLYGMHKKSILKAGAIDGLCHIFLRQSHFLIYFENVP